VLPSLHLNLPEQEAAKEFASVRKKALLRRIGAFLFSGVATFFGFFTILIVVGDSVLFTYWISKDE
jgi:hypothetical protein